jgi:hypothetical protein
VRHPANQTPRNRSSLILLFGPLWDMRLLVSSLVVAGHVVSELRGVRFSGFPFECDIAYKNLPCTAVQAVKAYYYRYYPVNRCHSGAISPVNFHPVAA